MSEELLRNLNDKQKEAVRSPLGPVLVLAGAGSGKTRVLVHRIVYLLQKGFFRAEEILALTFTNKAAGEMRSRIERSLSPSLQSLPPLGPELEAEGPGEGKTKEHSSPRRGGGQVGGLTMGTFHSVCARILRTEIEKLNLGYTGKFVIYDSDDQQRLIKQIVLEMGLGERVRHQVFGYYISAAKNQLVEPSALRLESNFLQEALQRVYEEYCRRLREHNALDFDDLLLLVCRLWQKEPKVLQRYQERFRYVLVDEYQDTNHAQYTLLRLLVKRHHNLFVVGDDAQSIYGFRGANLQNILNFRKDYPKARVITLEQNYRSTQTILDAAARVIKLNPTPYEKKLWTDNLRGEQITLYEAADEVAEAEFVLQQVMQVPDSRLKIEAEELQYVSEETPILDRFIKKNLTRGFQPFLKSETLNLKSLNDNVILYRTHAQSRPFEELMLRSGIPYQIVGGFKFYERQEIKDALAYLRLTQNPRDLVSLMRVVNVPARGVGEASFKIITQALQKYDYDFLRLSRNLAELELSAKAKAGANDFFSALLVARDLPPERTLAELMHLLVTRTGFRDMLLDGSEEGRNRWENVEELFNVAARYKKFPWAEGLSAFLEEVALMTDLDNFEEEGNKLTLMTLHSAKGLEFENVFLVGLEEGLLPHSRSLLSPSELQEEVRLAYVGITRAKRHLYLSYARQRQTYGEIKRSVPSRIIKAIPPELLKRVEQI